MTDEPARRPDLRLAVPALAAWVAAALALGAPARPVLAIAITAAGAAVAVLLAGRRWSAGVAAVLVAAAAGAGCAAARVATVGGGPLGELAERKAAVELVAVITKDPVVRSRGGYGFATATTVVVRARAEQVRLAGRTIDVRAPVLILASDRAWSPLLPSQRVRLRGRLQPPQSGDLLAAVVTARGPPRDVTAPSLLQRAAGHARAGLRRAVAPLPERERGLLPGLVVGDTSRMVAAVEEDFRTTGMTHLTAVSGANVAIVVGAVIVVARTAGLRRWGRLTCAVAGLAGFVVLARPDPSVLRASVMGLVGLLALGAGTRRAAVPALAAAVLTLVLLDPSLARSPGFALSTLATAGLLLVAPGWRDAMARRIPRVLAEAVAIPAAAQAACTPIIAAMVAEVSLVAVPANLLAVPAVAPATVLGVTAAVLSLGWLPAAQAVAWVAWAPTAWLVRVAEVGAQVPYGALPWAGGLAGALLAVGVGGLILAVARHRIRRVAGAAAAGVVAAVIAVPVVVPAWPPPGWLLVACDVGQGDALVLSAGHRTGIVVDAGPDAELVDGCLRRLGIRTLPLVILTHLHADHVVGLPGVLRGRRTGAVAVGPGQDGDDAVAFVARVARRVPQVLLSPGDSGRLGPVTWEVLGPTRHFRGTRSDPNNNSVVLRVTVRGVSMLLTGDVEPEAQDALLRSGEPLAVDVLKVPHHGSDHQSAAFLRATQARIAVMSLGADNDYGHPSRDTVGVLEAAGTRTLRTDRSGDVAVTGVAGAVSVATRGENPLDRPGDLEVTALRGKIERVIPPGRAAHRGRRRRGAARLACHRQCRAPGPRGRRRRGRHRGLRRGPAGRGPPAAARAVAVR